jgi:hypothetical protein
MSHVSGSLREAMTRSSHSGRLSCAEPLASPARPLHRGARWEAGARDGGIDLEEMSK